jgi:hypothetical protein
MLKAWTSQSIRGALGTQQKNQGRMQRSLPKLCGVEELIGKMINELEMESLKEAW